MWDTGNQVSMTTEHCSNCGAPLHPFADSYGCEVLHGSYGGGLVDARYDNALREPRSKDKFILCPKCMTALHDVEKFTPPNLGELFCLPHTDKIGKVVEITVTEETHQIARWPAEAQQEKYEKTRITLRLQFPNKNRECNGWWPLHLVESV